jgi:hypothetical protein
VSVKSFIDSLEPFSAPEFFEFVKAKRESGEYPSQIWVYRDEVKPVDLFCYLGARFGQPNGMQNFLRREDTSDNLIHWEWCLKVEDNVILIQEHNFRTELHFMGESQYSEEDKDRFIRTFKADFANFGPQMSQIRNSLEHWDEFLNPYFRIRISLDHMKGHLDTLALDPNVDRIPDLDPFSDSDELREAMDIVSSRYSLGLGICFGIRTMLPMRAESFLNLFMYTFLKPEIKNDDRLREHTFRQPIDVRLRSLSINCQGMSEAIDYEKLSNFHTLMMERNDTVHGNVNIEKLRFNDVFFLGRVPVFNNYVSFWDRTHGIMLQGVGLETIEDDVKVVEEFEEYLLSTLSPQLKEMFQQVAAARELGIARENGRLGCLFPNTVVDFFFGPQGDA